MTDDQAKRLDIGARAIGILGALPLYALPVTGGGIATVLISVELRAIIAELIVEWDATFPKEKQS